MLYNSVTVSRFDVHFLIPLSAASGILLLLSPCLRHQK